MQRLVASELANPDLTHKKSIASSIEFINFEFQSVSLIDIGQSVWYMGSEHDMIDVRYAMCNVYGR